MEKLYNNYYLELSQIELIHVPEYFPGKNKTTGTSSKNRM